MGASNNTLIYGDLEGFPLDSALLVGLVNINDPCTRWAPNLAINGVISPLIDGLKYMGFTGVITDPNFWARASTC